MKTVSSRHLRRAASAAPLARACRPRPLGVSLASFTTAAAMAAALFAAAGSANAATLYWDGDANGANNDATTGAGLGTAGNWNHSTSGTPLINWWPGSGTTDQSWVNANNDTAAFWGTAGTVTLTDAITVGGLQFNTTAYTITTGANTLTFGAATNNITLNSIAAATITGAVAGNAVTLTGGIFGGSTAGTLTLNGTSTTGWTGATVINSAMTMALAAGNQALLGTTGITLNGGNITLTNTTAQNTLDRVANGAAITSNGGTFTYSNTTSATLAYAETIGSVALTSGQLNIVSPIAMTSTGTSALTLTDLTRASNSSVVAFAGAGGLNLTTNQIKVATGTTTTAGQIIGPWAIAGTTAVNLNDYAVYNGTNVVSAAIAASAETTWTAATDAYTVSAGATLTGTRTITALRATGGAQALALGGNNLETFGILGGGTATLTISGAGAIRQQGTSAANLYVTTGSSAIDISSVIADNTGALTLVKSGTGGTLTLSGTNTYSGGTILNAGTLSVAVNNNLGAAAGGITFNGSANLTLSSGNIIARAVTLNNGAQATVTISTSNGVNTISGAVTGTGGLTLTPASTAATLTLSSTGNTFTGPLRVTGAATLPGTVIVNSLADSSIANGAIRLGGTTTGTGTFTWGSGAVAGLTLNNRQIDLSGTTGGGVIDNSSGNTAFAITVNTDLSISGAGAKTLTLQGANTGANTFAGKITNGTGSTIGLTKAGTGNWTLSGANTYTGATTVIRGSLISGANNVIPDASAVSLAPIASTTAILDLNGFNDSILSLALDGAGTTAGTASSATVQTGTGTLTLLGGVTYTNSTNFFGAAAISGKLSLGTATRTFTVADSTNIASELTVSAVISEASAAGIIKAGAGNMVLSGANTFSGGVSLNAGTLTLGSTTALGATAGTLTIAASTTLNSSVANLVNANNNALTINGDFTFTGTQSLNLGTGAVSLGTVAGTVRTLTVSANTLTLGGVISDGATATGLTKAGAGTLVLSGASGYTGAVVVNAGILNIQNATALGTTAGGVTVNATSSLELQNNITVGAEALSITGTGSASNGALRNLSGANTYGGTVTLAGAATIQSDAGTLTLSAANSITGTQNLTFAGAGSTTVSGTITTSTGTVTKNGTGTLTMSGANTYSGATAVNGGGLTLDYSTQDNSKLSDSTALTLGGVAVSLNGGTHTEVVSSTNLNAGASSVAQTGGTSILRMNAITRNAGGTINFGAGSIADTDTSNTATSILGGWATVAGTDWAVSPGTADGAITALGSYVNDTWAAGNDTTVTTSSAPSSGSTTNSLRFNAASANTVTLAGINTLTSGGILVTSNVGANASLITGGTLAGANTADLIIHQNNTGGTLTIASTIANNTGATGLTKSGAGTLILSNATNTYTGKTYLNGGITRIQADASLGTAPGSAVADQLTMNGGTLQFGATTITLNANRGITLLDNGGTFDTSLFSGTVGGVITGSGALTKIGANTLTLSLANTYTGTTTISAGGITMGNAAAFGTGTSAIQLTDAATGLNNVTLTAITSGTLSRNISVNNNGSGTVTLAGNGTVFSGAITLNNKSAILDATNTVTFSGVISGTGNLTKTNTGTNSNLTLSGNNTFVGDVVVRARVLALQNSNALGAATNTLTLGDSGTASAETISVSLSQNIIVGQNIVVTNNNPTGTVSLQRAVAGQLATISGNITLDRSVSVNGLTFSGNISGTGGISSVGSDSAVFSGTNTYGGGTNITANTLTASGTGNRLGSGLATVSAGANLYLTDIGNTSGGATVLLSATTTASSVVALSYNPTQAQAVATIASGSSGGVLSLYGTTSHNQTNALDMALIGDGTLFLGGGSTGAAATTTTYTASTLGVGAGSIYRLGGGAAATLVFSNDVLVNGSGNTLTVGAPGGVSTVRFDSANASFTGATTVNTGTLSLFGAGTLTNSAITANNATTVAFDSSTLDVAGATRASSLTLKGATLTLTGNANTNTVDTVTNALTAGGGSSTVTVTGQATRNDQLVAGSLARSGNGTALFRGLALGTTTIASNTNGATNISFGTSPSAQLVGGGGAAGTTNISILPYAIGGITAASTGTSFVTYDANGIRPLDLTTEYATLADGVSSNDNYRHNSATALTLTTGATVNSLLLSLAGGTTGTGTLTVTNGAVFSTVTGATIATPLAFGAAEGIIGGGAGTFTVSDTITGIGGLTTGLGAGTVALSGVLNFSGGNGFTVNGNTTLSGSSANTFTGTTTVNGGTLTLSKVVGGVNAITGDLVINAAGTVTYTLNNQLPGTSNITINGGTLNMTTASDTVGTVTLAGGSITNTTGTLTSAGTFEMQSGTVSAILGGAGIALNKTTTGTVTLSGTNTYTGATTVSAGTLLVSGSISGSIATVNSAGSTLGGTGTVGAVTVNSGASLQGGDGVAASGALTSGGAVSLTDGSIIKLTLGASGTHSTLARTAGTWSFDADQAFLFNSGAAAGTYDNIITGLAVGTAGLATIGTWTLNPEYFGSTFTFDGTNVDLVLVPEPGTAVSLLGGLGMLLGLQRFRRRRA